MKNIRLLLWLTLLLAGCKTPTAETPRVMALVFDKPAILWEERLPLGNGRLGAMPDGGIAVENIILNEISLWSGSPANDLRQGAYQVLPAIRELLYKEQTPRAQEIMYRFFTSRTRGSEGSSGAGNTFGSYQVLGSLSLDFIYDAPVSSVSDYSRMLDIATATSFTSFNLEGVTYTRECFTSLADDVIILRLTASQPGSLSFKATLKRPERALVRVADSCLIMEGSLVSGQDTIPGMRYYTRMEIIPEGRGRLSYTQDSIILQQATQANIIISAATDFMVDSMSLSPDSSYIFRADSLARRAAVKEYPGLKKDHIDTYQHFFHRVNLHLPDSSDLYFKREGTCSLLPPPRIASAEFTGIVDSSHSDTLERCLRSEHACANEFLACFKHQFKRVSRAACGFCRMAFRKGKTNGCRILQCSRMDGACPHQPVGLYRTGTQHRLECLQYGGRLVVQSFVGLLSLHVGR